MENIAGVTEHLRRKIIENGGDPEREVLNLIPAKDGKTYLIDENEIIIKANDKVKAADDPENMLKELA